MKKHLTAFWSVENMSYQALEKIEKHFSDFSVAWENGSLKDFIEAGINKKIATEIVHAQKQVEASDLEEELVNQGVNIVCRSDQEYPEQLKQMEKPPYALYCLGEMPLQLNLIAMVGTRKASAYGEASAKVIAEHAIKNGIGLVSGLAFGIDKAAHLAFVLANTANWAVLASGICDITPRTHIGLAKQIIATKGGIISEYPYSNGVLKHRFIERNRLIAGLSKCTLVIEAPIKSGALHTAHFAMEYGREVLAVPGEWTRELSKGCNQLISQGAGIFHDFTDLDLVFGIKNKENKMILSISHALVLEKIRSGKNTQEEILKDSSLNEEEVILCLTDLEIRGIVKKEEGKYRIYLS